MAAFYLEAFSRQEARAIPVDVATFESGITNYCRGPLDNLAAGLGERARLIEFAAGLTYHRLGSRASPSP
jgi:hypothetical protein